MWRKKVVVDIVNITQNMVTKNIMENPNLVADQEVDQEVQVAPVVVHLDQVVAAKKRKIKKIKRKKRSNEKKSCME